MADEATEGVEEAAPRQGPAAMVILAVALVGVAAGAGVGGFVIAPKLLPKAVAAQAAHGEAAEEEVAGETPTKDDKGGHGGAHLFRLDNLIVNPAGTNGQRYLMVSVAFEVGDKKAEEQLKAKDVQLRDAVVGLLEAQSLEALTTPGARDDLKRQLAMMLQPIVGGKKPPVVFIPQFLVQ